MVSAKGTRRTDASFLVQFVRRDKFQLHFGIVWSHVHYCIGVVALWHVFPSSGSLVSSTYFIGTYIQTFTAQSLVTLVQPLATCILYVVLCGDLLMGAFPTGSIDTR